VKILYFAWLRARIGHAEEEVALPSGIDDVAGLLDWLGARGRKYADALQNRAVVRVAVNREYVGLGQAMIRVQSEDFDVGAELERLTAGNRRIGGVASFVGLVRDPGGGDRISALTLEHYPGMTEKKLAEIELEAHRRWPLDASLIIHRYGRLEPGDRIVLVATASPHREAALGACHFLIDWLKTDAPFWKSEETPQGERWVQARAEDEAAKKGWKPA
jgi:molybdopterin synthase catalytic subunit